MNFHEFLGIFYLLTLIISIVSCIWFQFWYQKLIRKTMALKMIAILNLSNLIYHASFLFSLILPEDFQEIPILFLDTCFGFSIIWISSIAFFVYNSLIKDKIINQERYFRWSLFILTSFSIFFSTV